MMSGHGANPLFFNEKIKIGHPEHSQTPTLLHPITFHFCLTPPPPTPPPPRSGRHMCITPYIKSYCICEKSSKTHESKQIDMSRSFI